MNKLLAPNSIEERDAPMPPTTPEEMYDRLIGLVRLERVKIRSQVSIEVNADALTEDDGTKLTDGAIAQKMVKGRPPSALVIRRSMTRLLRETRKIENLYTVVTASEEAPGEIVVQVYVPSQGEHDHICALLY